MPPGPVSPNRCRHRFVSALLGHPMEADAVVALGHGPHDPSVRGHVLGAHRLSPPLRERHGRPNRALTSLLLPFGEWDGSSALRLPRARSVPLPRPLRNKGAMLLENSRPNSGPPRPMRLRRPVRRPGRWRVRQPPGVAKPPVEWGRHRRSFAGQWLVAVARAGSAAGLSAPPCSPGTTVDLAMPALLRLPANPLRRAATEQRSVTTWWSRRIRAWWGGPGPANPDPVAFWARSPGCPQEKRTPA